MREFLKFLWLLQNNKAVNGVDSIALATRFGNFMIRPPSGTEPVLSRVKLMGALAILIESVTRTASGPLKSPAPNTSTQLLKSTELPRVSGGSPLDLTSSNSLPSAATSGIPSHMQVQTRPKPSLSIGMQTVDVARSAVIVIDSAQKTLVKFQGSLDDIHDKEKLHELLKKLNVRKEALSSCCSLNSHAPLIPLTQQYIEGLLTGNEELIY